jgi:hypothetical protein
MTVLAAVMLAAYAGVVCAVMSKAGAPGVVAASLAAGLCLTSAAAALLISHALRDPANSPANSVVGMLLPMMVRTGLPLVLALVVRTRGPGLVEAGFVYYLIGFYLLAWVVALPMSLPQVERWRRSSAGLPRENGNVHV